MESKLTFLIQVEAGAVSWVVCVGLLRDAGGAPRACMRSFRLYWRRSLTGSLPCASLPHRNRNQALGASREEAIGIILKYPQVLNLDVEKNLRAKIDFFTRELQGSPEIVRGTVGGTPSVLGYSLSKRIIPRVAVMRSLGVEPTFVDHIWVVSSYTELRFAKWLEKGVINDVGAFGRGDTEVRRRMKVYRGMLRSPAA